MDDIPYIWCIFVFMDERKKAYFGPFLAIFGVWRCIFGSILDLFLTQLRNYRVTDTIVILVQMTLLSRNIAYIC